MLEEFEEKKEEIINNILAGPDLDDFAFKPTKENLLEALYLN